jgi:hypothetical protein
LAIDPQLGQPIGHIEVRGAMADRQQRVTELLADRDFSRRLLRGLVSAVLIGASVFIAAPLAMLGFISRHGQLEDLPLEEGKPIAWASLGVAALIWVTTLVWFSALNRQPIRWRFSVRAILIIFGLIAVVLGIIAIMVN